jgi:hypothetical protein
MRIHLQNGKTQSQQAEFMLWLQAMLSNKRRRAILHALLEQYELPVIEIGKPSNG